MNLRSKYPNYRWRTVQFANHRATIDNPSLAADAKKDPAFGVDFWEVSDEAAAATATSTTTTDPNAGNGNGGGDGGKGGDHPKTDPPKTGDGDGKAKGGKK